MPAVPIGYKLNTTRAQSSGPENIGTERRLAGHLAQGPVLSPPRITPEITEKSSRSRIGRTLSLGQVAEGMGLISNLLQYLTY